MPEPNDFSSDVFDTYNNRTYRDNKPQRTPLRLNSPSASSDWEDHLPCIVPLTWSQKVLAGERRARRLQQREQFLVKNRDRTTWDPVHGLQSSGDGQGAGERSDTEEMILVASRDQAQKTSVSQLSLGHSSGRKETDTSVKPIGKSIDRAALDKENVPTALPFPSRTGIAEQVPHTSNPFCASSVPSVGSKSGRAISMPGASQLDSRKPARPNLVGNESDDPFFRPDKYEVLRNGTSKVVEGVRGESIMQSDGGSGGSASVIYCSLPPSTTPSHQPSSTASQDPAAPPISGPTELSKPSVSVTFSVSPPIPSSPPRNALQVIDLTQTPLVRRKKKVGKLPFTPMRLLTGGTDECARIETGAMTASGMGRRLADGAFFNDLGGQDNNPAEILARMDNTPVTGTNRKATSPMTALDPSQIDEDEAEVADICHSVKRSTSPEEIVSAATAMLDRMSMDREASPVPIWATPAASPAGSVRSAMDTEASPGDIWIDGDGIQEVPMEEVPGNGGSRSCPSYPGENYTSALEIVHEGFSSLSSPQNGTQAFPPVMETGSSSLREEPTADRSFDSMPSVRARRLPKKRVMYSSEEEEEEFARTRPKPSGASSMLASLPLGQVADSILVSSGEESVEPIRKPRRFKPAMRFKKNPFVDDEAEGSGTGEDLTDDSLGSLADFIADSSDESKDGSEESAETSAGEVLRFSPGTGKAARRPIAIDGSDSEDASSGADRPVSRTREKRIRRRRISIVDDDEPSGEDSASDAWLTAPVRNRAEKKKWNADKVDIARDLCAELDANVFGNKLASGNPSGHVRIEWSVHLRTTAGRACYRRVKNVDGSNHIATHIDLSEKVLDTQRKVINTVAHELCHLACYVISRDFKGSHGPTFEGWAQRVMKARPDIKITTLHSYVIAYKYEWQCSNAACGVIFSRQSKSIDIAKQACGKCRSKLQPIGKQATTAKGTATPRKASAWEEYLKTNLKVTKASMPGSTHKEVMARLGESYRTRSAAAGLPVSPMPQNRMNSLLAMATDLSLSD